MKKGIKYMSFGLLSVLLLLPVSCTDFEEFKSETMTDPVALGLTVGTIKDSTAVINAVNPSDGYITLGIMEDPGSNLEFDKDLFFSQNVEGFQFITLKATKDQTVAFDFEALTQYTDYVVYGVSSNADGVTGDSVKIAFKTGDTHGPVLVGSSPEFAGDLAAVLPTNGEITLEFDEPVVYDNTKTLKYEYYNYGVVSQGDDLNVTVDGKFVTISSDNIAKNREIIFISWDEGTFKDVTGNPVAGMESGLDAEGYLYGFYMRVVLKFFQPVSISPEGDTVSVAQLPSIVLTFDENVGGFHNNYKNGLIDPATITYEDEDGDVITKVVKNTDYTVSGKTVTIAMPLIPEVGQKITLILNDYTFKIGLTNPNGPITASWVIGSLL